MSHSSFEFGWVHSGANIGGRVSLNSRRLTPTHLWVVGIIGVRVGSLMRA